MTELLDPAFDQPGGRAADQPCLDTTAYGSGPDDSITDVAEAAAITHHVVTIGGVSIAYTATAGHLVAVDPVSSKPSAKFFYVAFTRDGAAANTRPVTFFYNGGPGSSAVFLLLGSFAPRRIKTNMPGFTPPPPYTMEDNPDSLIDRSDLVYINPVGTGYSSAIAPFKNRDFWGVDQDARSIKQFIKRYLTANGRWNSPKFLYGESYGTARTCVLAWMLHEDGIDLNGLTLQSSVLDYPANFSNAVGLMPTFAADAWYHNKTGLNPPPVSLPAFMDTVTQFSSGAYAKALAAYPNQDPTTVQTLSQYLGVPANVLIAWQLNVEAADRLGHSLFLITLLQDQGARARRLRRPCDGHRHRHRGDRVARRRHERPDDGGRRRRLHCNVEHLSQHRTPVHLDLELRRPQRPGVPVLGFQPRPTQPALSRNPTPKAIRRSTRPATSRPRWRPILTSSRCRRTAISIP